MRFKAMAVVVFVWSMLVGSTAWGATEKSGLIYYPTDGASLVAIHTAAVSRGLPAHYKLTHTGSGVTTPYIIASGVTFEDYETFEFEDRAILHVNAGVDVIGYASNMEMGDRQQIKSGPGRLHLKGGGRITPFHFGAQGGAVDDIAAFTDMARSFDSDDGGTVDFINTGSGYTTSAEIEFAGINNLTIIIQDDITLTATTANAVIQAWSGAVSTWIENIEIIGIGNPTIDGNGDGITYVYGSDSPQYYDAVGVQFYKGVKISGLHATNGLIGSIAARFCDDVLIEKCTGSNSYHNNGIAISGSGISSASIDPNDLSTTTNGTIRNCIAYNNYDYGITLFNAPACIIDSCWSWGNGHDSLNDREGYSAPLVMGGGISVEKGVGATIDYNCKVINSYSFDNWGKGVFVTADKTDIIDCLIYGAKESVVAADPLQYSGNGIWHNNAPEINVRGTEIRDCYYGVNYLGSSAGKYAISKISDSLISGCTTAISGRGISDISFSDSSVSGCIQTVMITNGSLNVGNGRVDIEDVEFKNSSTSSIAGRIQDIDTAIVKNSEFLGQSLALSDYDIQRVDLAIFNGNYTDGAGGGLTIDSSVIRGLMKGNEGLVTNDAIDDAPEKTSTIYFIDPDAATVTGKATTYDLSGGTGVLVGIVDPDYPRDIRFIYTDGDTSISGVTLTVTGTLSTGETSRTEQVVMVAAATGYNTNLAFAKIDSVSVDAVTGAGAGDVLNMGWGVKFGLNIDILYTDNLYKIAKNYADSTPVAISATYNTVQFSTHPDGSNDYQVWLRSE